MCVEIDDLNLKALKLEKKKKVNNLSVRWNMIEELITLCILRKAITKA